MPETTLFDRHRDEVPARDLAVVCAVLLITLVPWPSAMGTTPVSAKTSDLAFTVRATDSGATLADTDGDWTGKPVGQPRAKRYGPAEALVLDGRADYVILAEDVAAARDRLPEEAFTVEAWVVLCRGTQWGGIVGALRDNGGTEKGWTLGYNDSAFYFGLSTAGADDGDGKMTYLVADRPFKPMHWHHITATYDGRRMRLFVDGELAGESTEQSGPILYPGGIPVTAGCYRDDNECHPMDGALHRIRILHEARTPEAIAAAFQDGQALARFQPPENVAETFVVKPYIQFPMGDRFTVMCETAEPCRAVVHYGTEYPLTRKAVTTTDATIHEVTVEGLEPETVYFYQVECRGAETVWPCRSEGRAVRTAVRPNRPYAFTVVGDTQTNPDVVRRIFTQAYAMRPNFQLHAGDVVGDGRNKKQWVDHFLGPGEVLMSRVGLFPVLGNHENDADWYYRYFSLPGHERWYSFRYGNGRFFMLDSNRDLSEGSEQYQWLDEQLAACDARWRFVVHHHPIYTSDNNDYGDTSHEESLWGDPRLRHLTALYEKHYVDIVFYGHTHLYERTWPLRGETVEASGVRYINTGGSGGYIEQFAPTRNWFTVRQHRAHHFCYLAVHGDVLELQAFDIDGRLFDSVRLEKDGTTSPRRATQPQKSTNGSAASFTPDRSGPSASSFTDIPRCN